MAPRRTNRPGRSASYYRKNPESYQKKLAYDTKYGKSEERRNYRTELKIARRKRGIDGKGGPDLSHTSDGRLVLEDPKKNRARNGHGNNGRLKKA
jgi:hypothetical protein